LREHTFFSSRWFFRRRRRGASPLFFPSRDEGSFSFVKKVCLLLLSSFNAAPKYLPVQKIGEGLPPFLSFFPFRGRLSRSFLQLSFSPCATSGNRFFPPPRAGVRHLEGQSFPMESCIPFFFLSKQFDSTGSLYFWCLCFSLVDCEKSRAPPPFSSLLLRVGTSLKKSFFPL